MTQQKNIFTKLVTISTNVLLFSDKISWGRAKSKKPHVIAEKLILLAAVDMVFTMFDEVTAKQL